MTSVKSEEKKAIVPRPFHDRVRDFAFPGFLFGLGVLTISYVFDTHLFCILTLLLPFLRLVLWLVTLSLLSLSRRGIWTRIILGVLLIGLWIGNLTLDVSGKLSSKLLLASDRARLLECVEVFEKDTTIKSMILYHDTLIASKWPFALRRGRINPELSDEDIRKLRRAFAGNLLQEVVRSEGTYLFVYTRFIDNRKGFCYCPAPPCEGKIYDYDYFYQTRIDDRWSWFIKN